MSVTHDGVVIGKDVFDANEVSIAAGLLNGDPNLRGITPAQACLIIKRAIRRLSPERLASDLAFEEFAAKAATQTAADAELLDHAARVRSRWAYWKTAPRHRPGVEEKPSCAGARHLLLDGSIACDAAVSAKDWTHAALETTCWPCLRKHLEQALQCPRPMIDNMLRKHMAAAGESKS